MEENNNTQPTNNKDAKVLRTYTSDMADAIRENEVSVIKIAMAEKEKKDREEVYQKAKGTNMSKVLLVLGGLLFVAIAVFGVRYVINKKKVVPIPLPVVVETFIDYDFSSDIDVSKATNASNLANIIKSEQRSTRKTIEALFLSKKVNELSQPLTSKELLPLISSTMPENLKRSLSDKFLLGKYSKPSSVEVGNKQAMFLVFETNDYNLAYASMLEWEGTMLEDLFTLFGIDRPNDSPFVKPWNDIVISNKDVRVLYNNNGEGLLYYAFANKNDIVIANNLDAMKEVMDRLIAKNAR